MNVSIARSLCLPSYTVRCAALSTRSVVPFRTRKSSLQSFRILPLQTPRRSKVVATRKKELKELLLPLCRKMFVPVLMPHPFLYHVVLMPHPSSDWGLKAGGGAVVAAEEGKRLLFSAISLTLKKIMMKSKKGDKKKKMMISSIMLRFTYTLSALAILILLFISHIKHL